MHFHQQAVPSRLRNLCHSQTRRTHPAGTASHLALKTLFFTTLCKNSPSVTFFVLNLQKEKGRREDRGESGLSSSWLPITAVRSPCLTHLHTHIHTQITKYSHNDCQVHWESSDSWSDWSTVAWRRAALVEAQTMNCKQRVSALTGYLDITTTCIWIWPVIYLTVCMCMCDATQTA